MSVSSCHLSPNQNNRVFQTFEECAGVSSEGFKDPRAHENAATGCLYNLGRLWAERDRHDLALHAYQKGTTSVSIKSSCAKQIVKKCKQAFPFVLFVGFTFDQIFSQADGQLPAGVDNAVGFQSISSVILEQILNSQITDGC